MPRSPLLSKPPLLIKLSSDFLFISLSVTRSNKLKTSEYGPLALRSAIKVSTICSPTFLIANNPKRMVSNFLIPSAALVISVPVLTTVKDENDSLISGGMIFNPILRHSSISMAMRSISC